MSDSNQGKGYEEQANVKPPEKIGSKKALVQNKSVLGTQTADPNELIQAPVNPDDKSNISFELHAYIREFINQADVKAAFIFAIASSIIGYLHAKGYLDSLICNPDGWKLREFVNLLTAIPTIASLAFCIISVWPRLDGSKKGFIYFGSIKEFDNSQDFSNAFNRLTSQDANSEILKHCYELSKICSQKYYWIALSLRSLVIGVIFLIIRFLVK